MAKFELYSEFKMTPQDVNKVANLPEWTTVLEAMIKSRQVFRTTKQERLNELAQDRQAHKDFLEEHRGTSKPEFQGKYALQPQQTELIWTLPRGCWVKLEDKNMHCHVEGVGMYYGKLHREGSEHHSASNLWSACSTQR